MANSASAIPNINQPVVTQAGIVTQAWQRFFNNLFYAACPTGVILSFAGPADQIPTGWLACGQNVSRTTFTTLFQLIGFTYGTGDGVTTFGLPPQTGTYTLIIKP